MWGPSVSGKIDTGETPENAAMREAYEELGINPISIIKIQHTHSLKHDHIDGEVRDFTIYYTKIRSDLSESFKLEPNEVAATRWVTLDILKESYKTNPESIIISSNRAIWDEIFEQLGNVTNYL